MPPTRPGPPELYDAEYYARMSARHWFTNNERKAEERTRDVLRLLSLSGGETVLEVGCATGRTSRLLASRCRQVIGVDLSAFAVEEATRQSAEEGISNLEFRVSDAARLEGIVTGSVDRVAAVDIVEHVDDRTLGAMFRACARILRPAGSMAIYTPNRSHYVEILKHYNIIPQLEGHIAVRTAVELESLLAASGAPLTRELLFFSCAPYPLFHWLDRWLAQAPLIGPWFRFRICMRLRRL